jgi:hypothetical protein
MCIRCRWNINEFHTENVFHSQDVSLCICRYFKIKKSEIWNTSGWSQACQIRNTQPASRFIQSKIVLFIIKSWAEEIEVSPESWKSQMLSQSCRYGKKCTPRIVGPCSAASQFGLHPEGSSDCAPIPSPSAQTPSSCLAQAVVHTLSSGSLIVSNISSIEKWKKLFVNSLLMVIEHFYYVLGNELTVHIHYSVPLLWKLYWLDIIKTFT